MSALKKFNILFKNKSKTFFKGDVSCSQMPIDGSLPPFISSGVMTFHQLTGIKFNLLIKAQFNILILVLDTHDNSLKVWKNFIWLFFCHGDLMKIQLFLPKTNGLLKIIFDLHRMVMNHDMLDLAESNTKKFAPSKQVKIILHLVGSTFEGSSEGFHLLVFRYNWYITIFNTFKVMQ